MRRSRQKPPKRKIRVRYLLRACSKLFAFRTASGGIVCRAGKCPGGFVASTLCNARREAIKANEQSLAVVEAAGDSASVSKIRAQIAADVAGAARIPGCDVSDLTRP